MTVLINGCGPHPLIGPRRGGRGPGGRTVRPRRGRRAGTGVGEGAERRLQVGRDQRGGSRPQYTAEVVGQDRSGVPDPCAEELRQVGAHRAVRQARAEVQAAERRRRQDDLPGVHQREHHQGAREGHGRPQEQGAPASDAVRPRCGRPDARGEGQSADQRDHEHVAARDPQGTGGVGQAEGGGRVEGAEDDDHGAGAQQDLPRTRAQHLPERDPAQGVRLRHRTEDRGLGHLQPDQQADRGEHEGQQERDAPSPRDERRVRQSRGDGPEDSRGHEQAQRSTQLRSGSVPAPAPAGRVLDRQQRGAAELPAQPDALDEPQQDQEGGRGGPPQRVPGQEPDESGRQAHHQERDDQDRLAAEAVAEVAEHHGAQGPGHEGDAEGGERGEQRAWPGRPVPGPVGRSVDGRVPAARRRWTQGRFLRRVLESPGSPVVPTEACVNAIARDGLPFPAPAVRTPAGTRTGHPEDTTGLATPPA